MYWIEDADAVSVMPTVKQATTTERHFFQDGNPQMGKAATVLTPDFMNMLEEELLNFVEGLGITPEKGNHRQMLAAVRKMMFAAGGILPWKPDTTYNPLPHIVWGSDNMIYVAEQPSGPGTAAGPQDPTTTTGYWLTLGKYISGGSGGGGQIFPGKIDFLANRYDELPSGYYACYGARYALATPQGQVLQSLPPTLRSTLKITITAAGINVPQMIVSGKGYFVRAVDGITRLPGSIEQDAARAITITGDVSGTLGSVIMTGAATGSFSATRVGALYADGSYPAAAQNVSLNGSITLSQENVGTENRPINIGMTPVIYLGV